MIIVSVCLHASQQRLQGGSQLLFLALAIAHDFHLHLSGAARPQARKCYIYQQEFSGEQGYLWIELLQYYTALDGSILYRTVICCPLLPCVVLYCVHLLQRDMRQAVSVYTSQQALTRALQSGIFCSKLHTGCEQNKLQFANGRKDTNRVCNTCILCLDDVDESTLNVLDAGAVKEATAVH